MLHNLRTRWLVLDSMADDFENLEQIYLAVSYEYINSTEPAAPGTWRRSSDFTSLAEVADTILDLAKNGYLEYLNEKGKPDNSEFVTAAVWQWWFGMSVAGRELWHELTAQFSQ